MVIYRCTEGTFYYFQRECKGFSIRLYPEKVYSFKLLILKTKTHQLIFLCMLKLQYAVHNDSEKICESTSCTKVSPLTHFFHVMLGHDDVMMKVE